MNTGIIAGYPKLVLASASPRRREILSSAGLEFEVVASNIPETAQPNESAAGLVRRLARAKAEATFAQIRHKAEFQDCPVLGADTVVTIGGRILGKPSSQQDAASMIQELAGNVHDVITGVAMVFPSKTSLPVTDVRVSFTRVYFRPMTKAQIQEYVLSGEPFDKAGGYGIQGLASKFVERIEGCYFNVVGLPIALVCEMLEQQHSSLSTRRTG